MFFSGNHSISAWSLREDNKFTFSSGNLCVSAWCLREDYTFVFSSGNLSVAAWGLREDYKLVFSSGNRCATAWGLREDYKLVFSSGNLCVTAWGETERESHRVSLVSTPPVLGQQNIAFDPFFALFHSNSERFKLDSSRNLNILPLLWVVLLFLLMIIWFLWCLTFTEATYGLLGTGEGSDTYE